MPHSPEIPSFSGSSRDLRELLRLAKNGESSAPELLFRRYRPYLRVVCLLRLPLLCQQREDASDIVQQTLIDANGGLSEFRGDTEAEFEAWVAKLLERNILHSVRRHTAVKRDIRREVPSANPLDSATLVWHSIPADGSSAASSVFRGEAALQLAQTLEQLPADQRIAVELRYLGCEGPDCGSDEWRRIGRSGIGALL